MERRRSHFSSPEAVRRAAAIVGIDVSEMSETEIEKKVKRAGRKIMQESQKTYPKGYRTVKTPPFISSLELSVAVIMVHSIRKNN